MPLKLYVFPPSPRSFKVLAVAAYLGLEHETCVVNLGAGEQRTPEYGKINPNRKVPALEEDGFRLWEANAILGYLAAKRPEKGLLPEDPQKRALVLQWQFWDLAHWEPACVPLIVERYLKRLFNRGDPDPAEVEKGLASFGRVVQILEDALGRSPFLAGPEPTLADFSVGSILNLAEAIELPLADRPNIRRWYGQLLELPGWRRSIATAPPAA